MLGDLGKLIVAKGFKTFPKIQNITQYGHTGGESLTSIEIVTQFTDRESMIKNL